jgi:Copper amine oxidase, enzyme domain
MATSGKVIWPSEANPIWRFDWILADSPDAEGIVIRDAFFRQNKVLYKASLPSLRVYYDGNCGPFKDPLHYNNAKVTQRCPNDRVCVYSYVSNGLKGLAVESYHIIGQYRLTHRWVFWENGTISPRLYSAGLQCPYNHRHHAYWRFDFDIDGASKDMLFEFNDYTGDQGWGKGWHLKTQEISRVKNPVSKRSWAVLDQSSRRGYHIVTGAHDGQADFFSSSDIWLMRYRGGEDKHGRQGSAAKDDLNDYLNGENINGQDVVIWYCGHLSHEVHAEAGDEWHHVGPELIPFGSWG